MFQADVFWQEVKTAIRGLLRTPAFSAAAVVTLALGIGATTVIFTLVNAVLLAPLPYSHPEKRVSLWNQGPVSTRLGFPTVRRWTIAACAVR
jgi:putative ABC transport system permease protein